MRWVGYACIGAALSILTDDFAQTFIVCSLFGAGLSFIMVES